MEIILTENHPNLGAAGKVVRVKPGYFRNYLLPRKLAVLANAANLKVQQAQQARIEAAQGKKLAQAESIAEKLKAVELTIEKDAGEGKRLFGSVTKMDIVAALNKAGFQVDKHRIELAAPIKEIGTYEVSVKLHPEVTVGFKLWVVRKGEK